MMDGKVDQDVREVAADYADQHIRLLGLADDIVAGKKDDTALVQAFARMKEAGRQAGLREAAEVARSWGERSTTPGEPTIWHAIGINIADDITALLEGEKQ